MRDIEWCVVIFFPQSYSRSQAELYDDRSVFCRGTMSNFLQTMKDQEKSVDKLKSNMTVVLWEFMPMAYLVIVIAIDIDNQTRCYALSTISVYSFLKQMVIRSMDMSML